MVGESDPSPRSIESPGTTNDSAAAVHQCERGSTALTHRVLIGVASRNELLSAERRDFLAQDVAAHLIILTNDVRDLALFEFGIGRTNAGPLDDIGIADRKED